MYDLLCLSPQNVIHSNSMRPTPHFGITESSFSLGTADFVPSGPSGKMFVCQLLVARRSGPTSNVGDNGQDVITMTSVEACLPLYLIHTTYDQMGLNGLYGSYAPSPFIAPGMLGASQGLVTSIRQVMGSYAAFAGKGERLGK
jgi:hypothetical protein